MTANPANFRLHPDNQQRALAGALSEVGWIAPVIVNETTQHVIDGHARIELAVQRGESTVPVAYVQLTEDAERLALATFDPIGALAGQDDAMLSRLLEGLRVEDAGLSEMLRDLQPGDPVVTAEPRPSLSDRFLVPPFSVLDARQGYWQERKRHWLSLGIQSELGRGDNALDGGHSSTDKARGKQFAETYATGVARGTEGGMVQGMVGPSRRAADQRSNSTGTENMASGTSIFDPVLCELAYRWFSPPGGHVLDPLAGGSVRGIVASRLGRQYTGVELRPEQVAANQAQAYIAIDPQPRWIEGDAANVTTLALGEYDLVFSCPPYADLERYSDDPRDISTLPYPEFLSAYRAIVAASVAMLRADRFACFVVGDVRDKQGIYRNFVSDTISAFQDAGAMLYNEAILVTAVGSLPIRVGKQFSSGRKLGKTHQNVLVFVKGDPRRATEACGPVDVELFDDDVTAAFGDLHDSASAVG